MPIESEKSEVAVQAPDSSTDAEVSSQKAIISYLEEYIKGKDAPPPPAPDLPHAAEHQALIDVIAGIYKGAETDLPRFEKLSKETLALLLEERKTALEAFLEYHDSTGAMVPELFHKKLGSLTDGKFFSCDEENKEKGHICSDQEDSVADYVFLAVSVDSLALLNTEGGHDAGDRSLLETVSKIKNTLSSNNVPPESYGIYHMKGGDFTVIAKKHPSLQQVEENLSASVLGTSSDLNLPYDAFLTCSSVDGKDLEKIFNLVQDALPADEKLSTEGNELRKVLGTILVTASETERDYDILNSLVSRSTDLLNSAKDKAFSKYYNNYVKKFLQNTELGTIEDFQKNVTDNEKVSKILSRIVGGRNLSDMDLGREAEKCVREVWSMVSSKNYTEAQFEHAARPKGPTSAPDFKKFYENYKPESVEFYKKLKGIHEGFSLFQSYLDLENDSSQESKLPLIQKEFENIKRYHTEMGQLFPDLRESIDEKVKLLDETYIGFLPDKEKLLRAKLVNSIALNQSETLMFKRNSLTGLLKKEQFYREMYRTVENALLSGKESSVIFGDLSNLRYINDYGGRKAGNAVLLATTEILEQSSLGFSPTISRYGGDEFALSFEGGFDTVNQVCGNIKEKSAILIPGDPEKTRKGYSPHRILLDLGASDTTDAQNTLIKLTEYVSPDNGAKLFNPDDEKRILNVYEKINQGLMSEIADTADFDFYVKTVARLMVKQADFSVDYVKGYNKLQDLYEMYKSKNPEIREALDVRWSYSQKSLGDADMSILKKIDKKLKDSGQDQITPEIYKEFFKKGTHDGTEQDQSVFDRIVADYYSQRR